MPVKLFKQFPAIVKFRAWFYGLSSRDQTALKWMVLVLLVFSLYFLFWLPTQKSLERSEVERDQAYQDLVWMKANERRALSITSSNPQQNPEQALAGKSLLSVVSSSAQQFKVELQRFEPRGESKVSVSLDKVPFNQMMLWIGNLSEQHGIRIDQIAVDKTDQPGRVSARLSFYL